MNEVDNTTPRQPSGAESLLSGFRVRLDSLDEQIVRLLAERMALCREIAQAKARANIPMMQPHRIQIVMERVVRMGAAQGLTPEFAQNIYRSIIDESCREELVIVTGAAEECQETP